MRFVRNNWIRRLDAHLERSNELFERFIEADERNTEAFERNTRAFERWEAQQDDFHEFMRELISRVERTGREHTRAIRELRDETRAQFREERGALLAILDRLNPGDS